MKLATVLSRSLPMSCVRACERTSPSMGLRTRHHHVCLGLCPDWANLLPEGKGTDPPCRLKLTSRRRIFLLGTQKTNHQHMAYAHVLIQDAHVTHAPYFTIPSCHQACQNGGNSFVLVQPSKLRRLPLERPGPRLTWIAADQDCQRCRLRSIIHQRKYFKCRMLRLKNVSSLV